MIIAKFSLSPIPCLLSMAAKSYDARLLNNQHPILLDTTTTLLHRYHHSNICGGLFSFHSINKLQLITQLCDCGDVI